MLSSANRVVRVDLGRIRENVRRIQRNTAVEVYAVVKADAYGLGAREISSAIADLVNGWCVFALREAVLADLWERTGKPAITLGPPETLDPAVWLRHHVRPAVSNPEQARALREANPLLCVDTGMQRFACPPELIDETINAGAIREAIAHAPSIEHVRRLQAVVKGKNLKIHAAASSLLAQPEAWLNAVRPGLAMYRDAVRVSAPLVEARQSNGPVGYTGFASTRHGVIICGYSNGLKKGPCLINGQKRRIIEVGMQSAFVELGEADRVGDDVILLGEELSPEQVANAWGSTPHEVIVRLSAAGPKQYVGV